MCDLFVRDSHDTESILTFSGLFSCVAKLTARSLAAKKLTQYGS